MQIGEVWHIDEYNSDDKYLYIDIPEGTLQIKRDDEGLVIDVYPLMVVDEPTFSTWILYTEMQGE